MVRGPWVLDIWWIIGKLGYHNNKQDWFHLKNKKFPKLDLSKTWGQCVYDSVFIVQYIGLSEKMCVYIFNKRQII